MTDVPSLPRQAGRTGLRQFSPDWLKIASRADANFYTFNCSYAILEEMTDVPALPRQAGRTGPRQFSPGWLGIAGRAGDRQFHTFPAFSVFTFER